MKRKTFILWIIAIVALVAIMVISSIKSWNNCIKDHTEVYCTEISR